MPDPNRLPVFYVDIDLHAARKRWRFYRAINKFIRPLIYKACRSIWKFLFNARSNNQQLTKTKPRVVLIRPDHVGDFVYSLPSILALKSAFSDDYSFEILLNPCNASVAKRLDIFDAIYLFKMFGDKCEKLLPSFAEFDQIAKQIGDVDILIDVRSDRNTKNLIHWIRAHSSSLSIFLHSNEELKKYESVFQFSQQVAVRLNLEFENNFNNVVQNAQQLLHKKLFHPSTSRQPIIVFCPEARHEKKIWSDSQLEALIKQIVKDYGDQYTLMLVGTDPKPQRAYSCLEDMRGKTSLDEAFDLINACHFFIGFDSGLTHLASLLGKPTIAIFNGYTDANEWAPIPVNDNLVVLQPTQAEQPNISQVMAILTTMTQQEKKRGGRVVS